MSAEMKPWPKCTVTMKDGKKERGEVAHIGETHITVRFDVPAWETPGQYGRQKLTFSYRDMLKEYVEIDS